LRIVTVVAASVPTRAAGEASEVEEVAAATVVEIGLAAGTAMGAETFPGTGAGTVADTE
jgi:hypothetical protein